MKFNFRRKS